MALTADQLQARIDSLETAIASGALIVQHGTSRIQYRSISDMLKAIQRLQAQLDALNGVTPRPRVNYIEQSTKGFGTTTVDDPSSFDVDDWGLLS